MNQDVEILESKILSDDWYTLKKFTLRQRDRSGQWTIQNREVYDRGNGATILLYSAKTKAVILTRQFRLPTFVNGNESGMLIETCAGLLDNDDPRSAILRETEEETGFKISHVTKLFEAYMSPGSVTEILHFYIGEYSSSMKVSAGGGIAEEEQIDVLEIDFNTAYSMISSGQIKDAKTIMLLQYAYIAGLCR
jgi:nudix-type nucleoside diphosphatase (YffH/AdpP family)